MMTPGAAQSAIDSAIAVMSAVPEATYRAALACIVTFDRREVLGRIDVPVLVLAAASDAQAPPAGMERMAGRIPGAEFVVLPDCAHLANFERPAAFAEAVGEFIARRCAG
jgi:3-oxoadipate enol-lactonase